MNSSSKTTTRSCIWEVTWAVENGPKAWWIHLGNSIFVKFLIGFRTSNLLKTGILRIQSTNAFANSESLIWQGYNFTYKTRTTLIVQGKQRYLSARRRLKLWHWYNQFNSRKIERKLSSSGELDLQRKL